MGSITHITGDLFSAPKGAILVYACKALGSWGAGIALAFKTRYPDQFEIYRAHCKQASAAPGTLVGTCLLIPGEEHYIACLFTSRAYGRRKDKPEEILAATRAAVRDLIGRNEQGSEATCLNVLRLTMELAYSRFNSGKFGVPWADTEAVLNELGVSMMVYAPFDEESGQ